MFPLTPDQHHWLEVATEDGDDAVLRRALPLGRGLGRVNAVASKRKAAHASCSNEHGAYTEAVLPSFTFMLN